MTIKEFVARYVPSPGIGALAEVDLEKMLQANTPAIFSQPSDAQLKAAICCGDGECPLKEWAATNNRSLDCETDQFDCRVKAVRALFNAITPLGRTPGEDSETTSVREIELNRIINDLIASNDQLRDALSQAAPHVCSLACPNKWQTNEEQPHSSVCKHIAATLTDYKATTPATRTLGRTPKS